MSRDIIRTAPDGDIATARALLLDHQLRMLPVVDAADRVVGSVGLRELLRAGDSIADVMSPPWTAPQDRPVVDLIAPLTDGKTHAAVIVDAEQRLVGLVTQTDLLATLGRVPVAG
jgi:CBS domain-containing membrane protein